MSTPTYGTTQKCRACDKVVYMAEMISADGVSYHNTCFRCSDCNSRLALSNYHVLDGKLYCKPHFEQLFKETGSLSSKKLATPGITAQLNRTPSKLSSFFSGTVDKCQACQKTVYPLEKVTMEGEFYHKSCFKCAHGGCHLTTASYAALDGVLYCKPHFAQLFKQKGSYAHFSKSISLKRSISSSYIDTPATVGSPRADIADVALPQEV